MVYINLEHVFSSPSQSRLLLLTPRTASRNAAAEDSLDYLTVRNLSHWEVAIGVRGGLP